MLAVFLANRCDAVTQFFFKYFDEAGHQRHLVWPVAIDRGGLDARFLAHRVQRHAAISFSRQNVFGGI
jgi:hypothetical protein